MSNRWQGGQARSARQNWAILILVGHSVACVGAPPPAANATGTSCIDRDGDGYGVGCPAGGDCNDLDPALHRDCPLCAQVHEGCACEAGTAPSRCTPELIAGAEGALVCKEGTRYCRDGLWTSCETVAFFQIPPLRSTPFTPHDIEKILPDGAGGTALSDCFKSIFPVEDTLDVVDGGLDHHNSSGVGWADGGGIRNSVIAGDGGDAGCDTSEDRDCDGIPNELDPFDSDPPLQTANQAIWLDLAPGESKDERIEVLFQVGSADVYFLVDATHSMATALTRLKSQFGTGSFLVDDPATALVDESARDCRDVNLDGAADNQLKAEGIVGNLACLLGDVQTGAGWFRQLPFSPDYAGSGAAGDLYGAFDAFAFEHVQDISQNRAATQAALASFETHSTGVSPEAWASALYTLVTQQELYFGWNRSAVPERVDCGANPSEHDQYSGWPCFRNMTVPVVVMLTDAASVNGPDVRGDGRLTNAAGSGTIGLDYPTSILGVDPGSEATYHPVPYHTNEDFDTAKPGGDIGSLDSLWQTQWGNTRVMSADIAGELVCGIDSDAADAVFAFHVDVDGRYRFNTRGTRFLHALALFGGDRVVVSEPNGVMVYGSDPSNQATPLDLGAIKPGEGRIVHGDNTDWSHGFAREMFTRCFHFNTSGMQDNGSDVAPYAEFIFEVTEAMSLDFSAHSLDAGADKFNVAMALYAGDPLEPTDCTVGVDCAGTRTPEVAGAVHLGVIDGRSIRVMGADTSSVTASMPDTPFVDFQPHDPGRDCEDARGNGVSGVGRAHFYDFTLNSDTTVAIETSGMDVALTTGWNEVLGLLRRDQLVECGFHNLVSNQAGGSQSKHRSYIEAPLTAGEYRVVVRGHGSSGRPRDAGPYKLIVKDLGAAPNSMACHNDSLGSDRSFTTDLQPGIAYHLVMRGHEDSDSGGSGNYEVVIGTGTGSRVACGVATDEQPWVDLEESLSAGDYFAVLKGLQRDDATEEGWYQLTVGDEANAISSLTRYANHSWEGSSGNSVELALKQSGVRVLPVALLSGEPEADTEMVAQMEALARASQAVDEFGEPLVISVLASELSEPSSATLGESIVSLVGSLTDQIAMDVGLDLATHPANPGFGFSYRAVDALGDGCAGIDLVNQLHLDCGPGATPGFVVTFSNPPEPGHVPINPDPDQVGYDMTLNLLGRTHCEALYDGSSDPEVLATCGCNDNDGDTGNDCKVYLADEVPVHIVPVDVVAERPYEEVGRYWQDFSALGCVDTELPDWDSLHYDATLPFDTSLKFDLCTADSAAALNGCSYVEVARVRLDPSCASEADCACSEHTECSTAHARAANGYCVGNRCLVTESPAGRCLSDEDCGVQGACAGGACRWSHVAGEKGTAVDPEILALAGFPILDAGSMLRHASMNGRKHARLRVSLYASTDRSAAPTLHAWKLLYNCLPGE